MSQADIENFEMKTGDVVTEPEEFGKPSQLKLFPVREEALEAVGLSE